MRFSRPRCPPCLLANLVRHFTGTTVYVGHSRIKCNANSWGVVALQGELNWLLPLALFGNGTERHPYTLNASFFLFLPSHPLAPSQQGIPNSKYTSVSTFTCLPSPVGSRGRTKVRVVTPPAWVMVASESS